MYNTLEEIENKINDTLLELSKYDKCNPKQVAFYDNIKEQLDELKRIKYDFINKTHTNEIYNCLRILKIIKLKYALCNDSQKQYYEKMYSVYYLRIKKLKQIDKGKSKLLKK